MEDRAIPETLVDPAVLYDAMRRGVKVTTAQASTFERRQYYESLISRHPQVAYLCVGSVYTGNHGIAAALGGDSSGRASHDAHRLGRRFRTAGAHGPQGGPDAASGKDLPAVVAAQRHFSRL